METVAPYKEIIDVIKSSGGEGFKKELVTKFEIATEVRGVGAIQALQLAIPGKPVLDGALADGMLINVTQDDVLRFLPPFLLQEKHVDAGVRILKRHLAAAQKQHKAEMRAARFVQGVDDLRSNLAPRHKVRDPLSALARAECAADVGGGLFLLHGIEHGSFYLLRFAVSTPDAPASSRQ